MEVFCAMKPGYPESQGFIRWELLPIIPGIFSPYLRLGDAMEKYVRSKYLLKNDSRTYPKFYFSYTYMINLDYLFLIFRIVWVCFTI